VLWLPNALPAPAISEWYSIDITDLYNAWMDGTYPNYGIQLWPVSNNNRWSEFYSSDYADDPSLRPRLVVITDESTPEATLSLDPATRELAVGDVFTVDVLLDTGGYDTDGVDVRYLRYNPNILEVQDSDPGTEGVQIQPGSLYPSTTGNHVDPANGSIYFSQITTGGSTFNSAGVLATITFTVIGSGPTDLMFDFIPGDTTDTNVAALTPSGAQDVLTKASGAQFTTSMVEASLTMTQARVRLQPRANRDQYTVQGTFTVNAGSDGIDVLNEDVTVVFDGFSETISAGSFVQRNRTTYRYDSAAGGITRMTVRNNGNIAVTAQGLELNIDLSVPVPLSVQIGDDQGMANIQFNEDGRFP
jgi:hypothetical protein